MPCLSALLTFRTQTHQHYRRIMPRADQATIDLLTDYFDAMEAKDRDGRVPTTPTTSA